MLLGLDALKNLAKRSLRMAGYEISRAESKQSRHVDVSVRFNSPTAPVLPNRPAPFVLVASNHGMLIVNRNDYHLRDGEGIGVGYQILNNSCFDYGEVRLLLGMLSARRRYHGDGVVALDCGANIGVHTVEWARHMHGWGRVIALEAQEKIYYSLCGNIIINNCLNVRAELVAVGSRCGELLVPLVDYLKPGSFGSLELAEKKRNEFIGQNVSHSKERSTSVRKITIDSLNLSRLDLIKIDVEGMEIDALVGAAESLKRLKPYLYVEILKSDSGQIFSMLEAIGYDCLPLGPNAVAIPRDDAIRDSMRIVDGHLQIIL